jgi:Acetyl/propionyl-CoA carboxylase, alpha subunit
VIEMSVPEPVEGPVPEPVEGFDTVLIANRGEIACRVIRTLRELGIRSVAVYSDADRDAKHVAMADVALRIGPAAPTQSYLNGAAVIEAAVRAGAQAVHPGYGFLAENAAFARDCAAAGLVFIGPSPDALEQMGDKIRAKTLVSARGVPVTPGIAEPGLTDDDLIAAADRIGFPVLVKPSAGGGGKGMEAVATAAELPAALGTARRVARAAFGDDTLFIERLIARPRHIEVQVLADAHGAVIHLGERECSLQRRHQKVIEEAPSALLGDQTRERIGAAACEVARSVGYAGAGTVEFLVSDADPDEFFFMEMNTRLQVEHPVTELVTGVDIVAWQVRIAAGEPLTLRQSDITLTGHAVEARVYAEDPARDFVPQTGTVLALHEPAGEGIRVDSALRPGLTVGADYDPMLSKIIAWAPDRGQALQRLERALEETVLLGVRTNIEYLAHLVADDEVREGRLDTGLIERRLPELEFRPPGEHVFVAAALVMQTGAWEGPAGESGADSLWRIPTGWRLDGDPLPIAYTFDAPRRVMVHVVGAPRDARVTIVSEEPESRRSSGTRELRGRVSSSRPAALTIEDDTVTIELDGESRTLSFAREIDTVHSAAAPRALWFGEDAAAWRVVPVTRRELLAEHLAARGGGDVTAQPEVRSPMPGTVVAVDVRDGDRVEPGATLVTVEAMKMEHRLTAPAAGIVRVDVIEGQTVRADQIVATVESDPALAPPPEPPEPPNRPNH